MAYTQHIGGPGGTEPLYQGTDVTLKFTVYQAGQTDAAVAAGTATPEDVTGWTFTWKMFDRYPQASPPLTNRVSISAGSISISGTYNVNPALNTQRVNVPLTATNLSIDFGRFSHSLRRADAGHVTELTTGDCYLEIGPS